LLLAQVSAAKTEAVWLALAPGQVEDAEASQVSQVLKLDLHRQAAE
jgi:hypothetical protein